MSITQIIFYKSSDLKFPLEFLPQAKVEVRGGLQLPVDEAKIAAWVAANGPVSIGINAFMMQFYMGLCR